MVFDSWFLVLIVTDIEPYNFVENFFSRKVIRLDFFFFFFEVAESENSLSVKGISLDKYGEKSKTYCTYAYILVNTPFQAQNWSTGYV